MLSRKIVSDPFRVTLRGSHPFLQDLVDDPVLLRGLGPEKVVPVMVELDLVFRTAGELGHQRDEAFFEVDNELRMALDIGYRALKSAGRLMNHDGGIGEREPLPLGACREQK